MTRYARHCTPVHGTGMRPVPEDIMRQVRTVVASVNSMAAASRILGITDPEVVHRMLDIGQASQRMIDRLALRFAEAPHDPR